MEHDGLSGPSTSINIPSELPSAQSNSNAESTFPLFNLHSDALKKIIRKMNPIHLLDICQIANNDTKKLIKSICKDRIGIFVKFDCSCYTEDGRYSKNKRYLVTLRGNGFENFISVYEKKLIENRPDRVDRMFGSYNIPCIFMKEKIFRSFRRESDNEEEEFDEENEINQLVNQEMIERRKKQIERRTHTHTFWDDIFDGVLQLADFVSDVFDTPITGVFPSEAMSIWKFRQVMNWILNRQSSIKFLTYANAALSEEDVTMFFGNCIVTEQLVINMKPDRAIQNYRFDLNTLKIGRAHWMSLNYLLNMDGVYMNISGSELTSQELNKFIKHWMNGGNCRLQMLNLRSRECDLDYEQIVDSLEGRKRMNNILRWKTKSVPLRGYKLKIPICGGFDIRRSDGALATVKANGYSFTFVAWTRHESRGGWNR